MADAARSRGEPKDDYFRLPGMVWIILVPFGMALVTAAAWAPHLVPYDYLGPVGSLTKYLVRVAPSLLRGIATCAWIVHAGEAYYASTLCRSKNITPSATNKWVIQTFIYGVTSLKYLIVYEGKNKST